MKGFIIYNPRIGSHVVSSILEPGLGLSGLGEPGAGEEGAPSEDHTAVNVAAMAFGVSLNVKAAVEAHHHSEQDANADAGNSDKASRVGEYSDDTAHLQQQLERLCKSGDNTINRSLLSAYDDGSVALFVWEHSILPLACIVVTSSGQRGGMALAEHLCKAFIKNHGSTYFSSLDRGVVKNFRKEFVPIARAALRSVGKQLLDGFLRCLGNKESSPIEWLSVAYSPELSAAGKSTLTSSEIAEALKAQRPTQKEKKKKKADGGAADLQLEPSDYREFVDKVYLMDTLRTACLHFLGDPSRSQRSAQTSDPDPDEAALLDYHILKQNREVVAATIYLTKMSFGWSPTGRGLSPDLTLQQLDVCLPSIGGAVASYLRVLRSGDFYVFLAVKPNKVAEAEPLLHQMLTGHKVLSDLKEYTRALYRSHFMKL